VVLNITTERVLDVDGVLADKVKELRLTR